MDYKKHLSKDPILKKILLDNEYKPLKQKNIPIRLIEQIVSQQLSTQVAKIIFKRFLAIYGPKEPNCAQVLATDVAVLRAIGLSNAKVQYVQNVAAFFSTHQITDKQLYAMPPEEIINWLTQIKGVGRWTVEMLLMFSLGQEDVFAVDDLGIQQAMITLYKIQFQTKKELQTKMYLKAKNWAPYKTYACLHLWKWKDNQNK